MNLARFFMVSVIFFVLIAASILRGPWLMAAEDFSAVRQKAAGDFRATAADLEAQWDRFEAQQREQWAAFRRDVEQKWQVFVASDRKVWVDYSDDFNARSRVDFENGRVEIEAIISPKLADAAVESRTVLLNRLKDTLEKKAVGDESILQDQLSDSRGRPVTAGNLEAFFNKSVIPEISQDPSPYLSRDGQMRRRYYARIDLVPDHINIRARRYLPLIMQYARRFELEPGLIMAVMHAESYFNPLAVSKAGAIGLMQVIPRYAGRDAYTFLYDQDWLIRPEYLYAPGINIELGSAYLHLLKNRYLAGVKDARKNDYLTICGYNWGPTAVRKNILNRYDVSGMSAEDLYALLREKTPMETRRYLKRVTSRMKTYGPVFNLD